MIFIQVDCISGLESKDTAGEWIGIMITNSCSSYLSKLLWLSGLRQHPCKTSSSVELKSV